MKIKIIVMLKNEDDLLLPWIKYHGWLVGFDNLIVFDNGSTSERTLAALRWAESMGVMVDRTWSTQQDFADRGEKYSTFIQEKDRKNDADFWLPLDCDEFLAVVEGGILKIDRDAIRSEIASYANSTRPLAIFAGLDNHPKLHGCFKWSPTQKKTFFAAGACKDLDHGFHAGRSKLGGEPIKTNIVYVHFHYKPYDILIEHSKEKLLPYTDDFSLDAMKQYIADRRLAFHCAVHLVRSEVEYLSSFNSAEYSSFPCVADAFSSIGETIPFSK